MKVATREAFTESDRTWQAMITWQPDASTKGQSVKSDGPGTHSLNHSRGSSSSECVVRP